MAESPNPPLDVLLSGTVFLDMIFTDIPRPPTPGEEIWTGGMGSSPGGIANLAVAAARLDLHTGLAACFSDDGYGQWSWEVLAAQERVDLSLSRVCPGWHSPVTVSMAYAGDRAMITHGHPNPVPTAALVGRPTPPRVLLADLEEDPWWREVAGPDTKVILDTGWDPTGRWDQGVLDNLAGAYSFTPNIGEALAYTRATSPEAALGILAEHIPVPIITLGADGVIALDGATGEIARVPALQVKAIDPTGAGDVFGAAFVCGTLADWELAHRLAFASLCSSLAVQQFGGALAAPGWGDILDWYHCLTRRAQSDRSVAHILDRYGFLEDVLPTKTCRAARRAHATVARFSDLAGSHGPDDANRGQTVERKEQE